MSETTDRAAALLRQAIKSIDAGEFDDAATLATKAAQLLKSAASASPDDEEDNEDTASGLPSFLDTRHKRATAESLKARNAQRERFGLPTLGTRPKAIRVENDQFVFSPATLAQSRNGRVRA